MNKVSLRKIKPSDKKYFAKWWRDKNLLKLTSGMLRPIFDAEVDRYFSKIFDSKKDIHFLITLSRKVIGHVSLMKRNKNWHETQIIIGEKRYWNKGYGSEAIKLLIKKVKQAGIKKIYLEVRPDNQRAIRVYEKSGFIKKGIKNYPKNKYLPRVLRMKLLS